MRLAYLFSMLLLFIIPWGVNADVEKGYEAYQQGDYELAVQEWSKAAAQGDAVAQFNLGQMYRLGKGVPQTDDEAVKWYILAAQQGLEYAQRNLKLMHRDGRASQADYDAGLQLNPKPAQEQLAVAEPDTQPQVSQAPTETAAAVNEAPVKAIKPITQTQPQQQQATKQEATEQAVAAIKPPAQTTGSASWLGQLNPNDYVVQLMAAPEAAAVDKFLVRNQEKLPVAANSAMTVSKGRTWHVVLMGPFSDSGDAKSALKLLPEKVRKNKPWVRKVSTVQALMPK